jgi:hypothetical protein
VVKGDLPLVLISDITFTSSKVILLQDDHHSPGHSRQKGCPEGCDMGTETHGAGTVAARPAQTTTRTRPTHNTEYHHEVGNRCPRYVATQR